MAKRTTIEIDEQLLARAKRALRCDTTRATVEEALRRAAQQAEEQQEADMAALDDYFRRLPIMADMDLLASEEMWR